VPYVAGKKTQQVTVETSRDVDQFTLDDSHVDELVTFGRGLLSALVADFDIKALAHVVADAEAYIAAVADAVRAKKDSINRTLTMHGQLDVLRARDAELAATIASLEALEGDIGALLDAATRREPALASLVAPLHAHATQATASLAPYWRRMLPSLNTPLAASDTAADASSDAVVAVSADAASASSASTSSVSATAAVMAPTSAPASAATSAPASAPTAPTAPTSAPSDLAATGALAH
jgi:hypothetical protein